MRSWNARDWDTFDAYHDQSDVVVYWPGRESPPTHGDKGRVLPVPNSASPSAR